jgi:hypothetical protein
MESYRIIEVVLKPLQAGPALTLFRAWGKVRVGLASLVARQARVHAALRLLVQVSRDQQAQHFA